MVKQLKTKAEFDACLKEAGVTLVVVDFTATWCGPCQRIAPKYEELAAANTNAVFVKIDVDDNEETAAACRIQAMPTFQFYVNGEKVDEFSGADAATLEDKVKKNIPQ